MATMKACDIKNLSKVIEAHTEQRTLEELAAQGRKRFRVVSGAKVLRLIEAVVDDTIRRETSERVRKDRDRIVSETKRRFDKVLAIQAEQEALLRAEKERARAAERALEEERNRQTEREARMLVEYQRRVARLEEEKSALEESHEKAVRRLEEGWEEERRDLLEKEREMELSLARLREEAAYSVERAASAEQELRLALGQIENLKESASKHEREAEMLAERLREAQESAASREEKLTREHEARVERLLRERKELLERMEGERGELAVRQERALAAAEERIEQLTRERDEAREQAAGLKERSRRLVRALRHLHSQQRKDRKTLLEKEEEASRAHARLEEVTAAMEKIRAELVRREQGSSPDAEQRAAGVVARLKEEMAELRALMGRIADHRPALDTESLDTLVNRLAEREGRLEGQFNFHLDRALEQIQRAIQTATARPIESEFEATDVLVARIFDRGAEMKTNLGAMSVEERTSEKGISGDLERLRAALGSGAEREQEAENR